MDRELSFSVNGAGVAVRQAPDLSEVAGVRPRAVMGSKSLMPQGHLVGTEAGALAETHGFSGGEGGQRGGPTSWGESREPASPGNRAGLADHHPG